MTEFVKALKGNMKKYAMLLISVGLVIIFQIMTDGVLLRPQNISNLIIQNAYVIILAVGMMCCILTGGNIDLSVGSLCAFSGAVCGYLIIGQGWNVYLVLLIVLIVSIFLGVWNGVFIAKFGVAAFIVTLSSQLLFRGGTYIVLKGIAYTGYPDDFLRLFTGYLPDYFGGGELHLTTVLIGIIVTIVFLAQSWKGRKTRIGYGLDVEPISIFVMKSVFVVIFVNALTVSLSLFKGIPIVFIPVAIIAGAYSYITRNTIAGRHLYAVGGNRKAAELSGVNVKRVLFIAYVNMALLAGIAGLTFTARMNSCSPLTGIGFEGDAIAACFIGGASPKTGGGTIFGALLGAVVIGLLNNGMSILGLQSDVQMCVKGLVLIGAVVFDVVQRNKGR